MTAYLIGLTAASLALLLALHVRHVLETLEFLDAVSSARDAGSVLIELAVAALDFLQDTVRHALIALAISAVSLAVYVWALARPARWKACAMLIVGLGYVWIGGAPPEHLRELLAEDERSLVLTTLLVLGHVYVPTAAVQLLRAAREPRYFADVRKEREKAVARLEERASPPIAGALEDEAFRRFHLGLSAADRRLFARICGHILAASKDAGAGEARRHVVNVSQHWPDVKGLFTRTYPHLAEELGDPLSGQTA